MNIERQIALSEAQRVMTALHLLPEDQRTGPQSYVGYCLHRAGCKAAQDVMVGEVILDERERPRKIIRISPGPNHSRVLHWVNGSLTVRPGGFVSIMRVTN
jgi:hypothetical protein